MIVGVHQPQYLPWLGYFDKIDTSDVFVILDDVQYKKNEWQNRNRIRTDRGWQWITVPVLYRFPQRINEVRIDNSQPWRRKHLNALITNYHKAHCFKKYIPFFEETYGETHEYLVEINIHLIRRLIKALDIRTELVLSSSLTLHEEPTERLIDICKAMVADTYLSGSHGSQYMDITRFEDEGINLIFHDFCHPVYNQLFEGFESNMSVIDLLFNYGEKSLDIIKGER